MANMALNGKTTSQNIYLLLTKLEEQNLLGKLEKELGIRKNADGYKEIFAIYRKLLSEEKSYTQLPSDNLLFAKSNIQDPTSKKKYFYKKLLEFSGKYATKYLEWYEECLNILNDVDALWKMELHDQAEMRFLSIYDVFDPDKHFQHEYNYVLSKIAYYYSYFSAQSFLGKEDLHKQFLNKSFLRIIEQFEHLAIGSGVIDRKRYLGVLDPEKENGAIEFYNHLASYLNKKEDFRKELTAIQNEISLLIENYSKNSDVSALDGLLWLRENSHAKFPMEFLYANYFMLRTREFYLQLKLNEVDAANETLRQLYNTLSSVKDHTEHHLVGFLYYISNELSSMRLDLYYMNNKLELTEPEFTFYQTQVKNLPLRIELNKLIYDFIRNNKWDFKSVLLSIKSIREASGKAKDINFELLLLEALIYFMKGEPAEAQDRLKATKAEAKALGLADHPFYQKFYPFFSGLIKRAEPNQRYCEPYEKAYLELHELNTKEHPIFNLLLYWVQKRVSDEFLDKMNFEKAFADPKRREEMGIVPLDDGKQAFITKKPSRRKWK